MDRKLLVVHCNALYVCKLSSSQDLVVGLVYVQTSYGGLKVSEFNQEPISEV